MGVRLMNGELPTVQEVDVVDHLIEERAGRLFDGLKGPAMRRLLYKLLDYDEAVRLADRIAELGGYDVLQTASDHLQLDVEVDGLENIPRHGGCMLVGNHPTGIADGIAMFDMLRDRRSDMVFFANNDALRVAPKLLDVIIPVDWVKDKRSHAGSKRTLKLAAEACRAGRAVVLFPSGRLSYMTWRGLVERPWQPTAISLARKFDMPIVPFYVKSRNSWLYYIFALLREELRDVTLFHELLNKRGRNIRIRVGQPLSTAWLPRDPVEATEYLKRQVESGLTDWQGLPPVPQRGRRKVAASPV